MRKGLAKSDVPDRDSTSQEFRNMLMKCSLWEIVKLQWENQYFEYSTTERPQFPLSGMPCSIYSKCSESFAVILDSLDDYGSTYETLKEAYDGELLVS